MSAPRESTTERSVWDVLTPRRIAAVVIALLFLAFVLQNREELTVRLLVFDLVGPLYLWLLAAFLLGGVAGWLVHGRQEVKERG